MPNNGVLTLCLPSHSQRALAVYAALNKSAKNSVLHSRRHNWGWFRASKSCAHGFRQCATIDYACGAWLGCRPLSEDNRIEGAPDDPQAPAAAAGRPSVCTTAGAAGDEPAARRGHPGDRGYPAARRRAAGGPADLRPPGGGGPYARGRAPAARPRGGARDLPGHGAWRALRCGEPIARLPCRSPRASL